MEGRRDFPRHQTSGGFGPVAVPGVALGSPTAQDQSDCQLPNEHHPCRKTMSLKFVLLTFPYLLSVAMSSVNSNQMS